VYLNVSASQRIALEKRMNNGLHGIASWIAV